MFRTCIGSLLLLGLSSNQQLHRPLSDRSFWNPQQLLKDEPISVWPEDAIQSPYVGHWKYWFRTKGMTSSTDDVIVSLLAVYPNFNVETLKHGEKQTCSKHFSYMDMGCGIGSSLLCVAHALRPHRSIGIEAQSQSVLLLQRTLDELPPDTDRPMITCLHQDLRQLSMDDYGSMWNTFDLITANPPYAKLEEGTLPIDPQRRSARFELRGGIEEYMLTGRRLLKDDGRMIFSFWSRDDERVIQAVAAAKLHIHRKIHIKMGKGGTMGSNVYIVHPQPRAMEAEGVSDQQLDITRNPETGGLCPTYTEIRMLLNLASRPLKR